MTATSSASPSPALAGLLRAVVGFTVAQAVVVGGVGVLLQRLVWTDGDAAAAVRASAWLAIGVQVVTFAVVRLVARQQVVAAWGLGVLLRFAVVVCWALLGVEAFGLAAGPALLSLVLFFFLSTVIEPLFLTVG